MKGHPYVPAPDAVSVKTSLVIKDHETLASLGVSTYHLGAIWNGAEPALVTQLQSLAQAAEGPGIDPLPTTPGAHVWRARNWLDRCHRIRAECFRRLPGALARTSANNGYPTRQECSRCSWLSCCSTVAVRVAWRGVEALVRYDRSEPTAGFVSYWTRDRLQTMDSVCWCACS
jgi:hypothetical protein